MSNLVSTLTTKANDQVSGVIDGLGRKMQNVGRGAKLSADVQRMLQQVQAAKRQLALAHQTIPFGVLALAPVSRLVREPF